MAIKAADKLNGSDTLNKIYEFVMSQNEYKNLTAVAIAALEANNIKNDEDIERIKNDRRIGELQVYLNDVVRAWIEEKMGEGAK
jgi:hypothetical protein